MKPEFSVFNNEQTLLKALIRIHLNTSTFDVDPMFYKGAFYREIPKPLFISDIRGHELGVHRIDARFLPIQNNSIHSIILDPPFVIANRPSQLKHISTKFSFFTSYDDLKTFYRRILEEAYRILEYKGVCVFKCQDYTDSKTIMTHCLVYELATQLGFYAKDIAILDIKKGKIANGQLTQRHLRKSHTYFWVFVKNRKDKNGNRN